MKKTFIGFLVMSLTTISFAATISADEVQKWEKIGISKSWIDNWRSFGIETPEEAQQWIAIGVTDFSSARRWKDKKISPIEAKEWMKLGITTMKLFVIDNWKAVNVKAPIEAKNWIDLNITEPHSVRKYIDQGITPEILKSWNDAGIYGSQIASFKQYGFDTPAKAKVWNDANIQDQSALEAIKKANIGTPAELKEWQDVGIKLWDIKAWKDQGLFSAKDAKEWKDVVGDPVYVLAWKKQGIENIDEVKKWTNLKIGYSEVNSFKKYNISNDEIIKWRGAGFSDNKTILTLIEANIRSPKEYEPYKNLYYLEHAVKLKNWNIEPNKLIESMSKADSAFKFQYFNNKDIFMKAYTNLKKHCKEIANDGQSFPLFASVDMSVNQDKCYLFVGTMMQRLDSKSLLGSITQKGLVSDAKGRYFFIEEFNGEWIENKIKSGIIKGDGLFNYNAQGGQKKVVPQGVAVYIE